MFSLWDPILQVDWHAGIFLMPPSPIPVPGFSWHIGVGFLWMSHISLFGSPKNNADTVLADGAPLASRGAEVGGLGLRPHCNIFPLPVVPNANLLIPLLNLGSSSKCVFAVSSVRGKDGAIACSPVPYAGLNLACADPCAMPTSGVLTRGTVYLGFTWGDFFFGLAIMALESAIDFALGKLCGALSDGLLRALNKSSILKSSLRPAINKLLGRGYSYAEKGKKGFQSLADKYIKDIFEQTVDRSVDATQDGTNTDAENVIELIAGEDESF
jgi:hypothetical protein